MQGKRPMGNGETSHYAETEKLQIQGSTFECKHSRLSIVHNWYREYLFNWHARAYVGTEGTEFQMWI